MDLDYFVLSLKTPLEAPLRSGGLEGASSTDRWSDGTIVGGVLGGGAPQGSIRPDEISVESTTLSEKQAHEAARDPANVVAPVMPVALITPLRPAKYGLLSEGNPLTLAAGEKSSWGIGGVGADTSGLTGAGVTVAILDTGIDAGHKAFEGVNLVRRNFSGADVDDTTDHQGHGTHCAGTVFGRDVEDVRIGVARGVKTAIIGKVLDDKGRGSTASVLKALHWAGGQGANIISMSLGFDFPGMQEQLVNAGRPKKLATSMALKAYRENLRMFDTLLSFLMLENPASAGLVVVAASGNESMRHIDPNFVIDTSLPAAASANIISVGAISRVNALYGIAPFSNVNPVLCAPGVDIVSAKTGGGLTAMSGTSMACPHVAGLAALWWEWALKNQGNVTGGVVRAKVLASAQAGGFVSGVGYTDRGSGRATAPQ